MKPRIASTLVLIVIGVLIALALGLTEAPVSAPQTGANPDDLSASATATMPEDATSAAASTEIEEQPPMQDFAADCFSRLRERNPRGRIVRLTANRLAIRCSAIVETDGGSNRWLFDWRNNDPAFRHEGELRWPEQWPPLLPETGIDASETMPERLASIMTAARAQWPETDRADWLYEIIWLPEPYSRPLVFISFDDRRAGADPNAALTVIFDGTEQLAESDTGQADALYPLTRFELREDHNFKGPLFESTALAEAAVSLEGDPTAADPHPLAAIAEHCMYWLHAVNTGSRVLRVAMDAQQCFLVLENSGQRDDYYLLAASGTERYTEQASLILEPLPTPNLLLDRSRLSSARIRERLQQAISLAGAQAQIDRLAIAWIDGAMIWQFDARSGGMRLLIYLDESGNAISPPGQFPVSVYEREQGFAHTRPALPFISEAANP